MNLVESVYDLAIVSFAIGCGVIALLMCVLDWWLSTVRLDRSSLLGIDFGGWRRTLGFILLCSVGAVVGAYLGGLVQLFDVQSVSARVIVGVGCAAILPRLLVARDGFGKPA